MDQELAKELKTAGFHQHDGVRRQAFRGHPDGYVYVPTLEELIEACGRPFFLETNIGKIGDEVSEIWVAGEARGMRGNFGTGLTRIEAVARLWLALNKK